MPKGPDRLNLLSDRVEEADVPRHPSARRARAPRVDARAARTRRGLSAGTYLALFALLPFAVATVRGTSAVQELRASNRQTAHVEASVEEYVQLSRVRAALNDEHYYVGALRVVADLGLSPADVKQLTGIDVAAAAAQATADLDAQVRALGWPELADRLAEARRPLGGDLTASLAGYAGLEQVTTDQSRAMFDDLHTDVTRMGADTGLDAAIDLLQASTIARQAITAQLTDFFSIRFGGQRSAEPLIRLVEARGTYREATDELQRLAADRPEFATELEAILADPSSQRFLHGVDTIIDSSVGPAPVPPSAVPVDEQLRNAADDYNAGSATARAHLELIDVAATEVDREIDLLRDHQAARTTRTVVSVVVAALVSVLFAFALRRTFGRPLRSLAADARAIGQGRFASAGRAAGPAEVRAASLALHDASAHLRLVEDQALALARGDLTDPVLHRPAAGSIGASLQEAVRTLAESMTEREEFRRRLVHEASHDGLTQLLNRNSTLSRLADRLATGRKVALLFIDLDGFKEINDEHGHQAGDQLLRTIAQRLATRAREHDHVGRLGGDEFVVITDVDDEADVLTLARRLLDAIGAPIRAGDQELRVSASIGVAINSSGTTTADELLRDADLAVYHAKDSGRSCISVCTDELRASIAEQAHHEHAIRRAIANDELVMHYQPIVLADDHTLHGFESLVRWDRPGHGLLSPDRFVPFAERTDLVVELDRWVLRRVARQLAEWSDHPELADLSVAVNVSGRSLGSPTFVDDVLGALGDAGVAPSRLVVEVTESALPDDLEGAADRLRALRANGVRTALDDFGTGYTSLAHLKTLPVDQIKIDRSFTKDEGSESLVKLIIDTGHLLGATILAEGVETEAQAERLARLGSDALQGYLFGRPCDAGALAGHRSV